MEALGKLAVIINTAVGMDAMPTNTFSEAVRLSRSLFTTASMIKVQKIALIKPVLTKNCTYKTRSYKKIALIKPVLTKNSTCKTRSHKK